MHATMLFAGPFKKFIAINDYKSLQRAVTIDSSLISLVLLSNIKQVFQDIKPYLGLVIVELVL